MQKALALEVARELNISPDKVYAVCKSFHDGLRELLMNPANCKSGILIKNFMVIKLKELKLQETLYSHEKTVEVKQEVLNNLKKYKRNEPVKKKQTEV